MFRCAGRVLAGNGGGNGATRLSRKLPVLRSSSAPCTNGRGGGKPPGMDGAVASSPPYSLQPRGCRSIAQLLGESERSFGNGLSEGELRRTTSSLFSERQVRNSGVVDGTRGMSKFASGFSYPAPKRLESIMRLETLTHASPEEITRIWNDHHVGRGHISGVMSETNYNIFCQRAQECPYFVLPVRKGTGFVSILLQAQMPHLLFTGLEDYKHRGGNASPYLTAMHYTDLVPTKGVVLIRADVVLPNKLTDKEGRDLLQAAHSYYLDDDRYKKVHVFNKKSREFDFKEVLKDLKIPLPP